MTVNMSSFQPVGTAAETVAVFGPRETKERATAFTLDPATGTRQPKRVGLRAHP